MSILWEDRAWEDYLYWQQGSRSMLKRINMLIRDIERSPFEGIASILAARDLDCACSADIFECYLMVAATFRAYDL
jgi:hypothetical protein